MLRATTLYTAAIVFLITCGAAGAGDLAPTGTLRAAFLATNPVQARVDAATGKVTGPVADLVEELARRLAVPFTFVPSPNAAAVIGHIVDGTADIGFLAYDKERAEDVDFAGGFAVMFNTYLVRAASPLQRVEDTDAKGLTIGVVKGQTQQLYLSSALKNARVKIFDMMPDGGEVARLLASGEIDAFGLNQQRAVELAAASKGAMRSLFGSFLSVEQMFVVRKGDRENALLLNRFVEELKASGFIQKSIDRAHIVGAGVAPRHTR